MTSYFLLNLSGLGILIIYGLIVLVSIYFTFNYVYFTTYGSNILAYYKFVIIFTGYDVNRYSWYYGYVWIWFDQVCGFYLDFYYGFVWVYNTYDDQFLFNLCIRIYCYCYVLEFLLSSLLGIYYSFYLFYPKLLLFN